MRVYLPATFADLSQICAGTFAPERGFAATARLLDITALTDEEEIAEQVRDAAADSSIMDLGSPLRVVVVADYPRADLHEPAGDHPAAVALQGRIGPSDIACVFVDEPDAAEDVRGAQSGDEEALARLDARDLLWWGVGELGSVPSPA